MKRQRSRNRGGGGGGGGNKSPHNANRAFDSNGPDGVKIRGHAQHVFEKYQQLARDAASAGDRVLAENYLQHAEHYFRVLRAVQPQRPASEILGRDAFTSGIDIDFEDESGAEAEAEPAEAAAEDGAEGQAQRQQDQNGRQEFREGRGEFRERRPEYRRDEYRGEGRDRDRDRDGGREGRDRDRGEGRQDRAEGRRRDDRGYRDDRPPREDRRRDDRGYRDERPAAEAGGEAVAEGQPSAGVSAERQDDAATLRSQDGGFSPAPAFLQARVEPAGEDGEAAPEPRRRRTRAPRRPAADAAPETESTTEEA